MTLKTGVNVALIGIDIASTKSMTAALYGLDAAQQQVALSALAREGADTKAVIAQLKSLAASDLMTVAKAKEIALNTAYATGQEGAIAAAIEKAAADTLETSAVEGLTAAQLQGILAKAGATEADAAQIVASAGVTTAITVEANVFNVLTASLWKNIAALAVWLVTNPVGWCILAAGAIAGVVGIVDLLTTSLSEQKAKLEEVQQSYDDTQSTITDLNSQLEETKSKIIELNDQDSLTIVEQAELEKLKETNIELQRQIDLQNAKAAIEAKKLATETEETVNKQNTSGEYSTVAEVGPHGGVVSGATTELGNFQRYEQELTKIQAQKQQLIDEGKATNPDGSDTDAWTNLIAEQAKYEDSLSSLSDTYQTYIDTYDEIGYDNLTDAQKQQYDTINALITAYNNYIDPVGAATAAQAKFDLLLNDDSFVTAKDKLIELANTTGVTSAEIYRLAVKNQDLADFLTDTGMSAEELAEYINTMADAEEDATETTLSLSDAFDKLSSAEDDISNLATAFDELSESGYVSFDTLNKIQSAFADVDGIEDYIAALMSASGNTEATNKVLSDLTYASLEAQLGLSNLAGASEDYIASMLKEQGVTNAAEVAIYAVAQAKAKLAIQTAIASGDISAFISNLGTEANAAGVSEAALIALAAQEIITNNTNLSFSQQISALQQLASAAVTATGAIAATMAISGSEMEIEGLMHAGYSRSAAQQKILNDAVSSITSNFSSTVTIPSYSYSGSSSSGSGGSSSSAEVDAYTVDIDKFYAAKQKIEDIKTAISKLEAQNDITDNSQEQIANLNKIIVLYKNEQDAILALNNARKSDIKSKITQLTQAGFIISYNAETNELLVKNKDLINQIVAGKGTDQEATNELRKRYEDLISSIEDENQANAENAESFLDLTKAAQDAADDIADVYKSLEDIISNTVKKASDKISELLDKEKEAFETQKSNLSTAVSTVVSYINDKIDALKDQNDELDKQVTLQEKLEALELAKTQRNKKIFIEGRGFVWQADQSAVNSTQKEYDSAVRDYNLDEQVQKLQDYADEWQNIIDGYQQAIDESITSSILGSTWQTDVLNTSADTLNSIASQYNDVCDQLNEDVDGSVANQIKVLQELSDAWDDIVDTVNDTSTDYESVLSLVSEYESANYEERLAALKSFVSDSIEQYKAYASAAASISGSSTSGLNYVNTITTTSSGVSGYADGGVDDYTGLVALHGTKSKPEVIFNNSDASKLYEYVHTSKSLVNNAMSLLASSDLLSSYQNLTPSSSRSIDLKIGDIYVSGVNNVDEFANEIKQKIPLKVLQEIYKK